MVLGRFWKWEILVFGRKFIEGDLKYKVAKIIAMDAVGGSKYKASVNFYCVLDTK